MTLPLPSPICEGLSFWPFPDLTIREYNVGAERSRYFPRDNLPKVPQEFIDQANSFFFKGGKLSNLSEGIDVIKATNVLRSLLMSFSPSHEQKETTAGYALWVWSTLKIDA